MVTVLVGVGWCCEEVSAWAILIYASVHLVPQVIVSLAFEVMVQLVAGNRRGYFHGALQQEQERVVMEVQPDKQREAFLYFGIIHVVRCDVVTSLTPY